MELYGILLAAITCFMMALIHVAAVRHANLKERERDEAPITPRVDWSSVYLMEQAIYGHTFPHLGAPPNKLERPEPVSVNNVKTEGNTVEHLIPLSYVAQRQWNFIDPTAWQSAIDNAKTLKEVNAVEIKARKEIELLLANVHQEGRPNLTSIEAAHAGILYNVIDACGARRNRIVWDENIWVKTSSI